MMVSRGSVLLSFCGFIALGALATACSSSPTSSPSTNAQVASYCDTLCTRASGCDRGIDKQTCAASCANQNAAVLPKLRQDVIGLITSCVDRKDCKDILTTNVAPACSDEAAASVAPSALAAEVCQSLETAEKKCGVSFDMAACLSRMKLYSEDTLGQARGCSAKACTDIAACVEATLGSLAGYSRGGIELDAGTTTPDVTVGVPDGGGTAPDDAAGSDAGPTSVDGGTATPEGGPVSSEAGSGPGPLDAAADAGGTSTTDAPHDPPGGDAAPAQRETNPYGVAYPDTNLGSTPRRGKTPGNRMRNYKFLGYADGDISKGLTTIALADFFDPEQRAWKILYISAAASWSGPCVDATRALVLALPDLKNKGVATVQALVDGTSYAPATKSDLDQWVAQFSGYKLNGVLDPGQQQLGVFFDIANIPWNGVVDLRTMEILSSATGGVADPAAELQPWLDWQRDTPASY